MPTTPERQVAHKVWIADLQTGEFTKQEGWAPSYIKLGEKQVSRVQMIVNVVSKFLSDDQNYGTITLDDGSDTIRAKAFGPDVKKIEKARVGKIFRFVGKVKKYNDELYLAPEILREVDANWAILHHAELGKMPVLSREASLDSAQAQLPDPVKKKITKKKEEPVEEVEAKNVSTKILALVATLDKGEGAAISEIIGKLNLSPEEAKPKIAELLASGEIYEPRKGLLKLL